MIKFLPIYIHDYMSYFQCALVKFQTNFLDLSAMKDLGYYGSAILGSEQFALEDLNDIRTI
jgi:hypothetical protein